MAKTYTPEEVKKKFESLPADIKALIYSEDMTAVLQTIGAKHQLHIDQIGELEGEAADVMTGFSQPEEFVSNLKESLNIDDAKAQAIAKDINEQLFVKIRESMKRASAQTPPPAQPPAPAAAAPVPAAPKPPMPAPKPAPVVPPRPVKPDLSAAEAMLGGHTIAAPAPTQPQGAPQAAPQPPAAPAAAPTPKPYSQDPYREPPTP